MKTLLVDTNILCLLVLGRVGIENIERHKRTRTYSPEDYEKAVAICGLFPGLIACPHVLTEASNLVRQTSEPLRSQAALSLKAMSSIIEERQVGSTPIMDHPAYLRLGLTDAIILTLIEHDAVLLSDDLDLCLAASAGNQRVINYNHVRDGGYTIDDIRAGLF